MKDDWFSRLNSFKEDTYVAIRKRLHVHGSMQHSNGNGRSRVINQFEMVSMADLRDQTHQWVRAARPTRARIVEGNSY